MATTMILRNCSGCRAQLQVQVPLTKLVVPFIRCPSCRTLSYIPSSRTTATPSPYGNMLLRKPSYVYGPKRAVICGILYKNTPNELKGCINDAKCMRSLLIDRFKFPSESIWMLTDDATDPSNRPNKSNIYRALEWLVTGCQPGDSLVFHFSGHGSRLLNRSYGEVDGCDETIVPLDHGTQGQILDDEINALIVRPIPKGAKLHAIIDSCSSGTVLDLPFLCRMNSYGQYIWEDHRPRSGEWKGSSGGEVICFSGCDDHQTSSDISHHAMFPSGAMTSSFIRAIESGQGTTYWSILNSIRSTIRNTYVKDMIWTGGSVGIGRIQGPQLDQEPQLTACVQFSVSTRPFSL